MKRNDHLNEEDKPLATELEEIKESPEELRARLMREAMEMILETIKQEDQSEKKG